MDRNSVNWRGYIPAVTTPFAADGNVDIASWNKLLAWLLGQRMHGIIVAGTQGEWFSLSAEERQTLFRAAGAQLAGKMTLIAGCSAMTVAEVVAHARAAHGCGFDGILVTPPPYMVPTPEEILGFYTEVNASVELPICVYNWPPGTNVDMPLPLLQSLARLSNVVAIKNSTASLGRFLETFFALQDQVRIFGIPMNTLGATLVRYHGADGTMGAGAVLGSELPDYFNAIWEGNMARALHLGDRNDTLMRAWFK